jgi:Zn-dependent protease with chaperone function
MKIQIKRFTPHQNAKVFAVLMAVGSLIFVVPFMVIASIASPKGSGPPLFMLVIFPIAYLVMGYITVAFSAWLYNFMYQYIGGLEFESGESDA